MYVCLLNNIEVETSDFFTQVKKYDHSERGRNMLLNNFFVCFLGLRVHSC